MPSGWSEDLAQLCAVLGAAPAATAILLDFDGTLAPIVPEAGEARPEAGTAELLDRLACRYGRVAIVSGRPRSFLTEHVGPQVALSGLYGLEQRLDGIDAEYPGAERYRPVVADAASSAEDALGPLGVDVENKGLSLTLHYRQVPHTAVAVDAWARACEQATGLARRVAKRSVELHPPAPVDKGTAVLSLVQGCEVVAYFGDDIGDLPAFAALDQLTASGRTTRKVAVRSTELPEEVAAVADVIIDGTEAVMAVLRSLDGDR